MFLQNSPQWTNTYSNIYKVYNNTTKTFHGRYSRVYVFVCVHGFYPLDTSLEQSYSRLAKDIKLQWQGLTVPSRYLLV